MSGIFSPIVWTDGDDPENIPTADDLNVEWKDSLNFLLGNTRPIIWAHSTTGTSLSSSVTEYNVPFNNELLKRGNMTHSTSTNNDQITLPYTGQYQGYMWGAFATLSVITGKCVIRLKKNGTQVAIAAMKPEATAAWSVSASLTLDAAANDVITMTMQLSAGTAVMGSTLVANPRILLYYVGDYV